MANRDDSINLGDRRQARPSRPRTGDRILIDARGSIDSRAFSERNEIVGYSVDKSDNHDPSTETRPSRRKWASSAGQGFAGDPKMGRRAMKANRQNAEFGLYGNAISGQNQYGTKKEGLPGIMKLLIVLVIILLILLGVIIFVL